MNFHHKVDVFEIFVMSYLKNRARYHTALNHPSTRCLPTNRYQHSLARLKYHLFRLHRLKSQLQLFIEHLLVHQTFC